MKLTLIAVLLFISSIANAQSFKSDFFFLHHSNVPDRLIYDQIKTYSFNANSTGEFLPYDAISNNTLVLSAYQSAANADMKIQVDYGPLQIVEEKTRKSSKTEEVNKVKVTTYTYAREINFRFPISYKATNTKNNVLIWNGQMLNTTIHNITTPEFNTEAEAITYVINNKLTLMPTKAAEIVNNFTGNQNAYFKRGIDFYPTQTEMEIFRFKKWKRDDEYNDHVKNVIKIFNQSTYDESPKLIFNKVKTDIDFFNSFDGQFNPKDKDDDILYWGNYMNLATIYYSLDDVEKADFYLKKLSDSSEKKTDYVKSLKNYVNILKAKLTKHYLNDRHFTYNPVSDYRLAGKKIVSEAASASENAIESVSNGDMAANDYIITIENKEVKGKIVLDNISGQIQFVPKDNPTKIEVLSPVSILGFKKDSTLYYVQKNLSDPRNPVKQFFKIVYQSNKIKLLEYVNSALVPQADYIGVIRPSEEGIVFFAGFGMKKRIAKYFTDCPSVSEKAGNGDYGTATSNNILEKYLQMCKDYTECK